MLTRSSRTTPVLAAVAALALFAGSARAQSLSGTLTVDNAFQVFLSTSPNTFGPAIPGAIGFNWPTDVTFGPQPLVAGTNYWMQVLAINSGGPGMFLGQFSLTGAFQFANGTQSLLTNTTDWSLVDTNFGGPVLAIADEGPNGTSPWVTFTNISPSAHFIWDGTNNCGSCTIIFSTPIIAQSVTPPGTVPEPSTWALLGSGLVSLGIVVRRRRSA